MTMPLTVDDVQKILHDAILQAGLAPTEEITTSIATRLASAITGPLNELVTPATGPVLTSSIPVSVMSVTEALRVRDAVSDVVIESIGDTTVGDAVAEGLLVIGYVDVPKVLALTRQAPAVTPKVAAPMMPTGPNRSIVTGPSPRVS